MNFFTICWYYVKLWVGLPDPIRPTEYTEETDKAFKVRDAELSEIFWFREILVESRLSVNVLKETYEQSKGAKKQPEPVATQSIVESENEHSLLRNGDPADYRKWLATATDAELEGEDWYKVLHHCNEVNVIVRALKVINQSDSMTEIYYR